MERYLKVKLENGRVLVRNIRCFFVTNPEEGTVCYYSPAISLGFLKVVEVLRYYQTDKWEVRQ